MAYTGSPKALGFFGSILSSAFQGATTSEVWSNLKEAAVSTAESLLGVASGTSPVGPGTQELANSLLSGIGIQDVNQMRSIAGQQVSAFNALAGANPEFAIDSSMIAPSPNAMTGYGSGLPQQYAARVGYTAVDEFGNETQGFVTINGVDVNGTVGDLMASVQTEASAFAAAYGMGPGGGTLTSVDSVLLGEV